MGSKIVIYLMFIMSIFIPEECLAGNRMKVDELKGIEEYSRGGYDYLTADEAAALKELQKETIIVGIPKYVGYNKVNLDGTEYGVANLYKEISKKHLGLNISFYQEEWMELLEMLKAGEIDLLLGMTPTKERKRFINFTAPYASDYGVVITPIDTHRVDTFEDLRGKTVYLKRGSSYEKSGRSNSKTYGFNVKSVEGLDYKSVDEDTFIFGTEELITEILGTKTAGIKAVPFYQGPPVAIGVSKRCGEEFYQIINKSLKEVFYKSLSTRVNEIRWIQGRKLLALNLTDEEKEFLKEKKTLDVYFEDNFFPHSFYDKGARKYQGAQVESVEEMARILGLQMNILNQPGMSWQEMTQNHERGMGDFLIMFRTEEREREYLMGESTHDEEVLLVGERSRIPVSFKIEAYLDYRIGAVDGDTDYIIAKRYFDEEKIVAAKNDQELVEMLEDKLVDYIILDKGALTYLQSYKYKTNLITAARIEKVPLVLGMKKARGSKREQEEQELLMGILDKVIIFSIDADSKYQRWSTYTNDVGLWLKRMNKILIGISIFFMAGCIKLFISGKTIKSQKNDLYNLLTFDQEVGCKNRRTFEKDLETHLAGKKEVAVMSYDIEGLYDLSGLYSHESIDNAMREGVRAVEAVIWDQGEVYRISKEEFAVIFFLDGKKDAKLAGEEIIEILNIPNIIDKKDHMKIRISMGIALSDESGKDVALNSRRAKYLSKIKEEDLVVAGKDIETRFKTEVRLEERMKDALRRREFNPFYQLKREISTGRVVGCEALVRWIDIEGRVVAPGMFIPVAENTGLITEIDMQMAEQVIHQISLWRKRGIIASDFKVSLNLSIKSLEKEETLKDLRYFLEKFGVAPCDIEVEVTETVFSELKGMVRENLLGLRELGVSLALDDFSAGHSSVAYLYDFKFDVVKLDRSILPTSREERAKMKIYRTLVELIGDLEMRSVGEGIETELQEEIAREVGLSEGQGYYYNRPQPPSEMEIYF